MTVGIVGKWRSDPSDREAIQKYGEVSLDFHPHGGLTYSVHADGRRQIILLTYRIDGDVLITNQPSAAREERTEFTITPEGRLVLRFRDSPSIYLRESAFICG